MFFPSFHQYHGRLAKEKIILGKSRLCYNICCVSWVLWKTVYSYLGVGSHSRSRDEGNRSRDSHSFHKRRQMPLRKAGSQNRAGSWRRAERQPGLGRGRRAEQVRQVLGSPDSWSFWKPGRRVGRSQQARRAGRVGRARPPQQLQQWCTE